MSKPSVRSTVFDAGNWTPLVSLGSGLPQLGINASPDTTNRLAVSSPTTLLNHAGNGHQLKLNKAAASDTASLLYQSNWSGRAEMGLAGDDHWRLKVSANGSSWVNALTVDAASGVASFAASVRPTSDNAVTLGASGALGFGLGGDRHDPDLRRPTKDRYCAQRSGARLYPVARAGEISLDYWWHGRWRPAAGPPHPLWSPGPAGEERA
ncbi:hypothetical protein N8D56_02390 [Devosia sp. A8/3-2]|nr:hypothetical protein N8D56_02390 [Devosia sp. A8/3-2]